MTVAYSVHLLLLDGTIVAGWVPEFAGRTNTSNGRGTDGTWEHFLETVKDNGGVSMARSGQISFTNSGETFYPLTAIKSIRKEKV